MTMLTEIKNELALRVERLRPLMREAGIDALLVASNSNLYYCALRFFRGYVYIPLEGEVVQFVIRPVDYRGEGIVPIRKPEQIPAELAALGYPMPHTVGIELDQLIYSDVVRLSKVFEGSEVKNGSPVLRVARMVKTPWEQQRMREDGIHQTEAYRRIPHIYKEGMTDLEFQIEIERLLRLEGCLGYSRVSGNLMEINLGSVLNGENADVPTPYDFAVGGAGVDPALPVGADGSIMNPGTTVMVDMNGAFNGYQTDMTRVWSIGEVPELAYKAHECSRRILRELEVMAVPGVAVAELFHRAEAIAAEEGLTEYFMGHRQKAAFIGHGVGIELNEAPVLTPRSKDILAAGMTLAIEPKFVIPHVGAVGVENTYIVTDAGLDNITRFPEELTSL